MINTCPACDRAQSNPLWGEFYSACLNCTARALAGSPDAHRALNANDPGPLRDEIAKHWPADTKAGRDAVWEWIQKIAAYRAEKDKGTSK